ncbi:MAG TPA: LEA type 2 family protein [Gemmatimonadales bacterium]|nr:LEA type 2 family protein [Gemmatimonadales bacterium]
MRRLVIAGFLVLVGCSGGWGNYVEPRIRLAGLALQSVGLKGGTLEAELDIENPNAFDIRGQELELSLDIQGDRFGDMRLADTFNLRKKDVTRVSVPLTFDWAGIGRAARAALDYGTVSYTIRGNATVRGPGGAAQVVPFSQDGTAQIRNLAGARIPLDDSLAAQRP